MTAYLPAGCFINLFCRLKTGLVFDILDLRCKNQASLQANFHIDICIYRGHFPKGAFQGFCVIGCMQLYDFECVLHTFIKALFV